MASRDTTWEYKTIKLELTGFLGGGVDQEALDKALAEAGAEGWELVTVLVAALYQGRTQNVLSNTAKIGIVFNPNGFLIMFQQPGPQSDLFISPSSLLRLTRGLLKLLDKIQPVAAH